MSKTTAKSLPSFAELLATDGDDWLPSPELLSLAGIEIADDSTHSPWRMLAVIALVADATGERPNITMIEQHGGGLHVEWPHDELPDDAVRKAFVQAWARVDGALGDEDFDLAMLDAVQHRHLCD